MDLQSVKQEIERYVEEGPELQALLDVYAAVVEIQDELEAKVVPELDCDEEMVKRKLQAGKHILDGLVLPVSPDLFRQGLSAVANTFASMGIAQFEADSMMALADFLPEHAPDLAERLVRGCKEAPHDVTSGDKIDESTLAFLLHSIFVPFYEVEASEFRDQINVLWRKGFCPFCGREPRMARLDSRGQRSLYCSLCRMEWPFDRLACPFCGGGNGSLQFLYVEGDRGHRADVCNACKRYLKACDERALGRRVVLDIEDIATLSLDSAAESEGYT